MSEDWPAEDFARRLAEEDRVVVLYHASWCPFSRIFMPTFEAAEAESSVPFVRADLRHPLDPRWDDQGVRVVPTLAYYEKGEELERVDGARNHGLDKGDLEGFLEMVEALNEEEPLRPKKKRRPTRARRL